ncbi:cobalamin B12-binding domain-containing protein [Micromonospora endolithica]|uniref:cobalamin B12-binding domain-containing protein n=1 Tax=Micromonospora endolithica TaxID=230091 RepID=UPI001EDD497F|nr:cobalamin B12-binding domain-containing protein [Micromonospora endolithica]
MTGAPERAGPDRAPTRTDATAVVEAYLRCLDAADHPAATRLALGLLDGGWTVADVLVDVVAAAQREIGLRWLAGRWSVAQEHAATHVSEQVVGAVGARIPPAPTRGHVLLACVEGEWHALAARIVAEVVRADGWRVTFLGASVPGRHLVSYLHQAGPDTVLLSCVQPHRLIRAGRMIEACRAAGVPVVAGGPGFGVDGRWAAAVGAAAWGGSARDATRLLDGSLPPATHAGRSPAPDADEYLRVLRRRRDIVQAALAAVDPPEEDAEALANAVAHLVDALAAAIRVGDPQLLLDHTTWQREALPGSRNDRGDVLATILACCAEMLVEHPRSDRYLRAARAAPGPRTGRAGLRPS